MVRLDGKAGVCADVRSDEWEVVALDRKHVGVHVGEDGQVGGGKPVLAVEFLERRAPPCEKGNGVEGSPFLVDHALFSETLSVATHPVERYRDGVGVERFEEVSGELASKVNLKPVHLSDGAREGAQILQRELGNANAKLSYVSSTPLGLRPEETHERVDVVLEVEANGRNTSSSE